MSQVEANFGRVYEDHVWRVYGFLAYHTRDRELAEDLTQLTFERALRAWSRFDPRRASEPTWLLAIARNALIDDRRRLRHERLDSKQLGGESDDGWRAAAVPGPEERLGPSPELSGALAELSERDREVLALRFGGDLTGAEIASLLRLTEPNVQQIVSRSLRKLRTLLEPARTLRSSVR